jgi:molybdenum cofactor cytidylyltransferase
MKIGLILLAAGNSNRMGSPKQLLLFQGKTLLRRAAEVGIESGCAPVVIVLGHDAARMQLEIENLPISIAVNSDWQKGMGSSIGVGIEHLEKNSSADAAIITLCDQPRVDVAVLSRLLAAYHEKSGAIVAARYGQSLGVPALFPCRYFPLLRRLPANSGAKKLLLDNADDVIAVPMVEAAVDVDTPGDFHSLQIP